MKDKVKCTRCKVFLPFINFNIKRSGDLNKNCNNCLEYRKKARNNDKCPHNKQKSRCLECGGKSLCKHQKSKYLCKECGGHGICKHKKRRSICKECKGGNICEHQKRRSICKECGGNDICEHNKVKSKCKECGGNDICEHKREKYTCKDCDGKGICEHKKQKQFCKDCDGKGICKHKKVKSRCKECGGGSICEHKKQRSHCKDCDPIGHLANTVGNSVRKAIGDGKECSSVQYLGLDIESYRWHIEQLFENGMSWDNYGEWHIDHIIPLKYMKENIPPSIEEVVSRLHFSNTQPKWAFDNISKGNRFIG